jgi:hypothetical protein
LGVDHTTQCIRIIQSAKLAHIISSKFTKNEAVFREDTAHTNWVAALHEIHLDGFLPHSAELFGSLRHLRRVAAVKRCLRLGAVDRY